MTSGWYLALLWCLCIAMFANDWLFRRVPNRLLLGVVAIYAVMRSADLAGADVGTTIPFSESLAGAVLAFVFMLPFYIFRAMGAGDVKGFAVLGLLVGPMGAVWVWLFGSLLSGVHALVQVCLAAAGSTLPVPASALGTGAAHLQRMTDWVREKRQGRRGIPYAAYMAVAALVQFYWINAKG